MNRSFRLAGFLPTRLQFSLRTLLILVVLSAIPAKVASLMNEYSSEQRLLADLGVSTEDDRRLKYFL